MLYIHKYMYIHHHTHAQYYLQYMYTMYNTLHPNHTPTQTTHNTHQYNTNHTEGSSTRGGLFTSLLYDMFEGSRWHTTANTTSHPDRLAAGTMALAGLTDFPDYMSPDSPRDTGMGGGQQVVMGIAAEEVVTSAMDAHPTRAVYLTGVCCIGGLCLGDCECVLFFGRVSTYVVSHGRQPTLSSMQPPTTPFRSHQRKHTPMAIQRKTPPRLLLPRHPPPPHTDHHLHQRRHQPCGLVSILFNGHCCSQTGHANHMGVSHVGALQPHRRPLCGCGGWRVGGNMAAGCATQWGAQYCVG